MFDVADTLMGSLASAKGGLNAAARGVSRSQTPLGSARTDSTLALAAGKAIFTEALLNAVHARLAEVKSVAHG